MDTVKKCLLVFKPMLETMRFKEDRMAAAAPGVALPTPPIWLDYLVRKGHAVPGGPRGGGENCLLLPEKNITLEELDLARYKQFSSLVDEDVYEAINIGRCVEARRVPGGPAPEAIREAIRKARQRLRRRPRG